MDSDLFRALVCFGVAAVCFAVVGTEVPCSDDVEYVQPEDEWCSGANPDCPSHWEAWNSLPPTME